MAKVHPFKKQAGQNTFMMTVLAAAEQFNIPDEQLNKLGVPNHPIVYEMMKLLRPTSADITPFKRDMRKNDGWKLIEDSGRNTQLTIETISKLVHVPFHKQGEGDLINGEEVVIRARGELKANWGQQDAEFLLDNQHLIPKSFRERYIIFTGTFWQYLDQSWMFPFLYWDGYWCLTVSFVDDDKAVDLYSLPGLRK